MKMLEQKRLIKLAYFKDASTAIASNYVYNSVDTVCASVYTQCALVYTGSLLESFSHRMTQAGRGSGGRLVQNRQEDCKNTELLYSAQPSTSLKDCASGFAAISAS